MAEVGLKDWAALDASATMAVTTADYGEALNSANAHDGNDKTASKARTEVPGGADVRDGSVTYTVTFAETVTIKTFRLVIAGGKHNEGFVSDASYPTFNWEYYTDAWYDVLSAHAVTASSQKTYKTIKSPAIVNVSKIRVVVPDLMYHRTLLGLKDYNWAHVYSMEAYGNAFLDSCGLRYYDGSNVISVAVETLDDHKVRIRGADGVTYGVPLVDVDHPQATSLRIYDGTDVKAFVDIT